MTWVELGAGFVSGWVASFAYGMWMLARHGISAEDVASAIERESRHRR